MKYQLIYLTIYFSLSLLNLYGQSKSPLLGTWIKKGSVADNLVESPFSDNGYLKYEFRENGLLYYSNSYLERGSPSKYRITEDSKLSLNYLTYNLVSLRGNDLVLTDGQNNKLHLMKIVEQIDNETDSISNNDIVYKANFKFHPQLNSDVDLYNYFFSTKEYMDQLTSTFNVTSAVSTMNYYSGSTKEDILVKVNFIVNRFGEVNSVKIIEPTNAKKESIYKTKIERTSGFWTPAKLNGTFVDTELTLTFIKLGTKTINLHNKADILFNKGIRYYEKGKYDKSLEVIIESISIFPENERYYFGRAQVYFKLDNSEAACNDLKMITKYNLEEVKRQITENCKD